MRTIKLPADVGQWPPNWKKIYEMRAVRLQSEKQLSKEESEKLAEQQIRKILETNFLNL